MAGNSDFWLGDTFEFTARNVQTLKRIFSEFPRAASLLLVGEEHQQGRQGLFYGNLNCFD